jgi:hypothetical protein
VTGSKQVAHGPVRHGENEVRLQAPHRAPPPQQPTPSVVKPEERPAASMKPGQESCVRSSGIITLLARGPSDGFGIKPASDKAMMINHVGVTNVARQR